MAKPNYQAGGSFLPTYPARVTSSDPWNFDKSPTVGTDVGQGAQTLVTDTSTQTLTNKTITTPTMTFTAADVTATGTTGSSAANITGPYPAIYTITGATGSGVNLGVPVPGAFAILNNEFAGNMRIYCVGGTINGTTGTTAATITTTGNKTALAFCSVAGAWFMVMNT